MKTINYRVSFKLPPNVDIRDVLDAMRDACVSLVEDRDHADRNEILESVTVSRGYAHPNHDAKPVPSSSND